jgi:hypothetical protein
MIPKILHYCFGMAPDFGGKPWSLVHYVCVKSAVERIKPSDVYFYYEYEPTGPWWELTREMLTPIKIKAPRIIFGNPIPHPAHRADVVRLEKLLARGGIYLDCDVFVHRAFDDLLCHRAVLGRQGDRGLCNAVILSEAQSHFVQRWYEEYRFFRGAGLHAYWDEHSVEVPLKLSQAIPNEITMMPPDAFFLPSWKDADIRKIFGAASRIDIRGKFANHLWESAAWHEFLEDLTPKRVRAVESNFHRWARPFVAELPDDLGRPAPVRRIMNACRRAPLHAKSVAKRTAKRFLRASS